MSAPHPPFGHLLPAGGEKGDNTALPAPRSDENAASPLAARSGDNVALPVASRSGDNAALPVAPRSGENAALPVAPRGDENAALPIAPRSEESAALPASRTGDNVALPVARHNAALPLAPRSEESAALPLAPRSDENAALPLAPRSGERVAEGRVRGLRRTVIPAAAIILFFFGGWTLRNKLAADRQGEWVNVARGDLVTGVEVTGTLAAVESDILGPPQIPDVWDFKISMLAPEGTEVKKDVHCSRSTPRTFSIGSMKIPRSPNRREKRSKNSA